MSIRQAMKMAWESIRGNKMRSFLTMLGMIIGVASVIALVSLVQGMINYSNDQYKDMGVNQITITIPDRTDNKRMTVQDMYDFTKENSDLYDGISPQVNVPLPLKHKREKDENKTISGVGEQYLQIGKLKLAKGRFIQYSDVASRNKVCVIGSYEEQNLFDEKEVVGQKMKIGSDTFTVVGVLKEKYDSSEGSSDDCVYVPYTTMQKAYFQGNITSYILNARDTADATAAKNKIEEFLYKHYMDDKVYNIFSLGEMLKMMEDMQNMMKNILGGIAGISLLVAGIGIMNIMLVSVTERTKEIGIRKSLGAKKRDIMMQFVLEAGTVSTMGGGIGILIGGLATTALGNAIGMDASPTLSAVTMAFGVSAGIGIIFGYLPANKAANLNPIDALRNE